MANPAASSRTSVNWYQAIISNYELTSLYPHGWGPPSTYCHLLHGPLMEAVTVSHHTKVIPYQSHTLPKSYRTKVITYQSHTLLKSYPTIGWPGFSSAKVFWLSFVRMFPEPLVNPFAMQPFGLGREKRHPSLLFSFRSHLFSKHRTR